jgi:2,4-dienoyl-CoA reductase-like NADH-dependent reductase (Old Yellow Enzyme family)
MTSCLFSPGRLGPVALPNRIMVSPMAQYSAVDHMPQPWHLQHLGSLAVSGPALVMIESTSVEPMGYGNVSNLALHSDAQEEAFARLIAGLRSFSDTRLGLQLGHSGRKGSCAHPSQGGHPLHPGAGGWPVCGPSALAFGEAWQVPVALDAAGLRRVSDAFAQAAARAARLDIDVLELHGAHGYLLHSFLSALSNRREDAYGGSFENRMRFPLEVAAAVRDAWPASRALGMRINCADWVEGGMTVDDTVVFASRLKAVGLDYVCVSNGSIVESARLPAGPGYLIPYAGRIRREAGIQTVAVGMIVEPALAEEAVASGQADMVAIARAFIDDPRWVWHAAEALGVRLPYRYQHERAQPSAWAGARLARPVSTPVAA